MAVIEVGMGENAQMYGEWDFACSCSYFVNPTYIGFHSEGMAEETMRFGTGAPVFEQPSGCTVFGFVGFDIA